jgi:hypothetical protein
MEKDILFIFFLSQFLYHGRNMQCYLQSYIQNVILIVVFGTMVQRKEA